MGVVARIALVAQLLLAATPAHAEAPQQSETAARLYAKGDDVSPGFHLEDRPRQNLLYVGAALAGPAYLLGAGAAAAHNFRKSGGWLLMPVAGPWVYVAANPCKEPHDPDSDTPPCLEQGYPKLLAIMSGLAQLGGASLLAVGLLATRTWVVPDEHSMQVVLVPIISPAAGSAGLFLQGQF